MDRRLSGPQNREPYFVYPCFRGDISLGITEGEACLQNGLKRRYCKSNVNAEIHGVGVWRKSKLQYNTGHYLMHSYMSFNQARFYVTAVCKNLFSHTMRSSHGSMSTASAVNEMPSPNFTFI
jgi:hypothetical protein